MNSSTVNLRVVMVADMVFFRFLNRILRAGRLWRKALTKVTSFATMQLYRLPPHNFILAKL
jgi:hypothetical protein